MSTWLHKDGERELFAPDCIDEMLKDGWTPSAKPKVSQPKVKQPKAKPTKVSVDVAQD